MKKIFTALTLAAALSLTAAQSATAAGSSCYSPTQFEAEQGLRIHSELRVIGLTCLKMPGKQDLYTKYQTFTSKHQSLITKYENDLISYYRAQGSKNPEKEFHTLRTGLANGISKHAINMSTASFCQHFGGRIDKALQMDQQKLRRWAQHVWPESPTSRPVCQRKA